MKTFNEIVDELCKPVSPDCKIMERMAKKDIFNSGLLNTYRKSPLDRNNATLLGDVII